MIDLAIIGGGPAGYVAAERAAAQGKSVILFERKELGGVCLNEGCIPTKTILYSAKILDTARQGDKYGVSVTELKYDYSRVAARKGKVVRKLVAGIGMKMKSHNVEVVRGSARIESNGAKGFSVLCGDMVYEVANVLIATGSEAFVPLIDGLAEASDRIMTNREALALKELPSSVAIIGGGVIGMEFASIYNSFGCQVDVIEMMSEILGGNDADLSGMLREIYTKRGVRFHLGCRVMCIEGESVIFATPEGEQQRVSADKVLVSVGRRPVVVGFGLEELGVELHRGGVKVDNRMQTNVKGLFAAGDVTGFSLLAHTASREAEVVVNNLCGKDDVMSYDAVPSVVYTNPEIASVGMSCQLAKDRGVECRELLLPMAFSGRFVAENEAANGMCKIVVGIDGRVLGVHMLGNPASEIIFGAAIAIEKNMTVEELRRVIFPHPTVSEIIKEVLFE